MQRTPPALLSPPVGRLPPQFFAADKYGVRGGVEYGFMSTTLERAVAVGYAGDGAATVIEMAMGFADRGAFISWLSQYPHEEECTPSGIEPTDGCGAQQRHVRPPACRSSHMCMRMWRPAA